MTKLTSALEYITGADFVKERMAEENARLFEATGIEHALPTEGGAKLAAEIYAKRMGTVVQHTGLLLCRLTGIELATRPLRDKE